MPFAGSLSSDRFGSMLQTAINRANRDPDKFGVSRRAKGNSAVEVKGDAFIIEHFYGATLVGNACITCFYYGQRIFILDLQKERVTDCGMSDYSVSTATNVRGWRDLLHHLHPFPDYGLYWCVKDVIRSTRSHNPIHKDWYNAVFNKFRQRVSWLKQENGVWYLLYNVYNPEEIDAFKASIDFLSRQQNWRYFTYDWTDSNWCRLTLSNEAFHKWELRERRRLLTSS